jgi:hypothetical protein
LGEILAKKKKKSKRRKKLMEMLEMLDERLVRGEISESTYNQLKAKYSAQLGELAEAPAAPAAAKPAAPVPAAKRPPERPAPRPVPGKTPWGKCPVCGGEWPPELNECNVCKSTALASHSVHKARALLALGPRGKSAKGFAHVEYGARRIAYLIDWLPISELSGGVTITRRYRDGSNDHAVFKTKTKELDVHFHGRLTSPEKISSFLGGAPERPAAKANVCPGCGAKLEPGAKFCTGCGKKLA